MPPSTGDTAKNPSGPAPVTANDPPEGAAGGAPPAELYSAITAPLLPDAHVVSCVVVDVAGTLL